jgi:hypothetical protein
VVSLLKSFVAISTLLLFAASVSGCADACQNDVVARLEAPDRKHDAVLFQRDCGATTGFSTQISILSAGDVPDWRGNVFIADDGRREVALGSWQGPWAQIRWKSPDALLVQYAEGSRIFKQDQSVAGVKIEFEAVPLRGTT